MRSIIIVLVIAFGITISALGSIPASRGIGIGVSPPRLTLTEGIGRLMLFNADDSPVSFSVSIEEGSLHSRPVSGTLLPHAVASVLISGDGPGRVRVRAESDSSMLLPALDVVVDEISPASHTSGSWISSLVLGMGGLLVLAVVLAVLVGGKRLDVKQPTPPDSSRLSTNVPVKKSVKEHVIEL